MTDRRQWDAPNVHQLDLVSDYTLSASLTQTGPQPQGG